MANPSRQPILTVRGFNAATSTHVATVFETDKGGLVVPPLHTFLAGRELELHRTERGTYFQVPGPAGYPERVSLLRAVEMFNSGIQHVEKEEAFPGEPASQRS